MKPNKQTSNTQKLRYVKHQSDLTGEHLKIEGSNNTVVISGAGLAGLVAAIVLKKHKYDVIVIEKRQDFTRNNIINVDADVEAFLKQHQLFDEFKETVAATLEDHNIIHVNKGDIKEIGAAEVVSNLQTSQEMKDLLTGNNIAKNIRKLFRRNGTYSVRIKDLQHFLSNKAKGLGIAILFDSTIKIDECDARLGVSKITLVSENKRVEFATLKPKMLFIAEGYNSAMAKELNMPSLPVKSIEKKGKQILCTDEKWIYGNVPYSGKKNFVVSVVDNTNNNEIIGNVIFNAKLHKINIAVSTESATPGTIEMEKQLYHVIYYVMAHYGIEPLPLPIEDCIKKPAQVQHEMRQVFSLSNVFCIGDSAGRSSPLAGMGGTLALTVLPNILEKLIGDMNKASISVNENFNTYSKASVNLWINKSVLTKQNISSNFFKKPILIQNNDEDNKEDAIKDLRGCP